MSQPTSLEVGIGFATLQSTYTGPRSQAALARDAVAEIVHAEELGFDSYWLSEHHHSYDGYNPSPLTLAAHLAAATSRIKLGTGIVVAPLHPPAEISAAVSALRSIAPGRPLRLGVGMGYREEEFAAIGHRVSDRKRLFETYVEEMRSDPALADVQWWFGGVTPVALRRAGRYGAGALLMFVTPSKIKRCRDIYLEAFDSSGGAVPRIGLVKEVWVDHDQKRLDALRTRLRAMWEHYASSLVPDPGDPEQRAQFQAVADDWNASSLVGTPSEVLDQLGQLIDGGVEMLAMRVRFDGVEHAVLRECMDLIATEVLPQLPRKVRA